MDPALLLTDPKTIEKEVSRILGGFGRGNGHVFNLGHGISQFTPPENVLALVDAVHRVSKAYHPEKI
ncbi:MAG: uroporphyrinogen decarboxylase family protein, partial [Betaproteobacteria bacterium]